MSTFDKESYKSYVEMSNKPRLLVEGITDKNVLKIAIKKNKELGDIEIDSAEKLIDFDPVVGNRAKVELICEELKNTILDSPFFGLVDREFREFVITDNTLESNLTTHFNDELLYWTLGHSIENYLFDIRLIERALISSTRSDKSFAAIEEFEHCFESVIQIISALSFSLNNSNHAWRRYTNFIDYTYFTRTNNTLLLNCDLYNSSLQERGLSQDEANLLIEEFEGFLETARNSSIDSLKLYCHGHTGLNIIRSTYAFLLTELLDDEENINTCFLRISLDYFFHMCIVEYLDIDKSIRPNFPEVIFDRL